MWKTEQYLLDPHTAIAYKAAKEKKPDSTTTTPIVVVGTAHYGKFLPTVVNAIYNHDRVYETQISQHPILARLQNMATRSCVLQNDMTLVGEYVAATVSERRKFAWLDQVRDVCQPSSVAAGAATAAVGVVAWYLLKRK